MNNKPLFDCSANLFPSHSTPSSHRQGTMASPEELSNSLHYYTVSLYDVPFDLPLNVIAEGIVPREDSVRVTALKAAHQLQIVPHQLQVYKEPLKTKFGYASYAVLCPESTTREAHDAIHQGILEWIDVELTAQLLVLHCATKLAQPRECFSSTVFIRAVDRHCQIFEGVGDKLKFRCFVLSKLAFHPCKEAAVRNAGWVETRDAACDTPWPEPCAKMSVESLAPVEILWVKKMVPAAPPVLLTNKDVSTTQMDPAVWRPFLVSGLSPLISVDNQTNKQTKKKRKKILKNQQWITKQYGIVPVFTNTLVDALIRGGSCDAPISLPFSPLPPLSSLHLLLLEAVNSPG
eukprot:gene13306-9143_t